MNKKLKKKALLCSFTSVGLVTAVSGVVYYYKNYKIPLKDYTAVCLYMASLDDEICRNELEGNKFKGVTIKFPPKIASLQYRYHMFLQVNKGKSRMQLNEEIKKFEARLEESKQYIGQPKVDLGGENHG